MYENEQGFFATTTIPLRALQLAVHALKAQRTELHDEAMKAKHAPQVILMFRQDADECEWAAKQIEEALRHVERYSMEAPKTDKWK